MQGQKQLCSAYIHISWVFKQHIAILYHFLKYLCQVVRSKLLLTVYIKPFPAVYLEQESFYFATYHFLSMSRPKIIDIRVCRTDMRDNKEGRISSSLKKQTHLFFILWSLNLVIIPHYSLSTFEINSTSTAESSQVRQQHENPFSKFFMFPTSGIAYPFIVMITGLS